MTWPGWFMGKVELAGCWLWQGARTSDGYAQAKVGGRLTRVDRWAWEQEHGGLDRGLVLRHLCGIRLCVNPDHLEPMPQGAYRLRHVEEWPERTHCAHGHPWTEESTYWYRGKYRQCRTCRKAAI